MVDWEIVRVGLAAISATGAAFNIGDRFLGKLFKSKPQEEAMLQAEATKEIKEAERAVSAIQLPASPAGLSDHFVNVVAQLGNEAAEIRRDLEAAIVEKGIAPDNRRERINILNRNYCLMIANIMDVAPSQIIPEEIKAQHDTCRAKYRIR